MSRASRIPLVACLLIVALRLAIGWQLLYEGLWKFNTQKTAKPWTAAGYLKNAQGPYRNYFRNLTGDPDELGWLDYEKMASKWETWHQDFVSHYGFEDSQKKRLNEMVNGSEAYYAALDELPKDVEFNGSLGKIIKYNAERKRLEVDGKLHLAPRERDRLLQMVDVENAKSDAAKEKFLAYQQAVKDVYARSSRPANADRNGVSFKERLMVLTKGDPERVGVTLDDQEGTIDHHHPGQIDLYLRDLARYETNLKFAKTQFQFDHLKKQGRDLAALRSQVVGPIKSLEQELIEEAEKLLTDKQRMRGPVEETENPMRRIDYMTMTALVVLGTLLIIGLFSRLSALAAAGLLASFYLAMPPWPGAMEMIQLSGPEHSFIVDKNFIEIVALCAIASLPTGRWFGVDSLVRRFVLRKKSD